MDDIQREQVIERLASGHELRNRGTGWWISAPHEPYKRQISEPVPDSIVNTLHEEKIVVIELLTTSAVARFELKK